MRWSRSRQAALTVGAAFLAAAVAGLASSSVEPPGPTNASRIIAAINTGVASEQLATSTGTAPHPPRPLPTVGSVSAPTTKDGTQSDSVNGGAAGPATPAIGDGASSTVGAAALPPATAPVVRLAPTMDAQRVIDTAPDGAVIVLTAGVHEGFSVQPRSGQFFRGEPGAILDGGGRAEHAFYAARDGHPFPDDVVVSGASSDALLEIRNYAGRLQTGAIHPHVDTRPELGMGRRWLVQWCDVHDNRATGIRTADGMTIRASTVHHNGQLGIGGTGQGVTIAGNEVSANRTRDDVDPTWEGGGVKLVNAMDARLEANVVRDNRGSGLWTDIDSMGTVIVGNTVVGNELAGIFDEISYGAEIRNNIVADNGTVDSGWYWNAGIQIAASRNVVVSGNQVSGNRQGIMLIQQQRSGRLGAYVLDSIVVQDNVLHDNGPTGAVRDTELFDPFSAAITFRSNSYSGRSAGNFVWDDAVVDAAGWLAVGHDS